MTAAVHYAATWTVAAQIPSTVAVLAEGALRAMNLHRGLKRAVALSLIGALAGSVGGGDDGAVEAAA